MFQFGKPIYVDYFLEALYAEPSPESLQQGALRFFRGLERFCRGA